MSTTKIEWADKVWNPVTGCSSCSPGCDHCYARRMANRLKGRYGYPADEPFRVTLHPDRLTEPLKWKKPNRIFVCSMGDLFHGDVPDDFINSVGNTIYKTMGRHTYLILTKRPQNMLLYQKRNPVKWWPFEKSHLGVTVCNQDEVWKIGELVKISAAVRWVSLEPMLGPISLWPWLSNPSIAAQYRRDLPLLDWVVLGGETGPGARPMDPDWAHSIVQQCKNASIPVFVKQIHLKRIRGNSWDYKISKNMDEWPEDLRIRELPNVQ